jgi:hypothetical protein
VSGNFGKIIIGNPDLYVIKWTVQVDLGPKLEARFGRRIANLGETMSRELRPYKIILESGIHYIVQDYTAQEAEIRFRNTWPEILAVRIAVTVRLK